MDTIDFGVRRSKVKVPIDINENNIVIMIEIEPLYASLSSVADILTMVRGWTLLILEVEGRCHHGLVW